MPRRMSASGSFLDSRLDRSGTEAREAWQIPNIWTG